MITGARKGYEGKSGWWSVIGGWQLTRQRNEFRRYTNLVSLEVLDVVAQALVAPSEDEQVDDVNRPGGAVGGVNPFHRAPLAEPAMAFMACASSTCWRSRSRR